MTEAKLLLDQVHAGDPAALADYIQSNRARLLAYIDHQLGSRLRSKIEPDDLLQEVSAEACRSLPTVKLTERDPFGWLCQVAQRKIIDAHRRLFGAQKRNAGREVSMQKPLDGDSGDALVNLLTASMTTASQAFSRNAKEIRLMEAMATLPPEQSQAIQLRYGQGLPSKEIAEQMGKSDGAVRVMLTRALNALREQLADAIEENNS